MFKPFLTHPGSVLYLEGLVTRARHYGWRSSIAAPIIVDGRLWGVMLVATQRPELFPGGAEERLAAFTDLVATALANAEAHGAVRQFGEEQAALGRVATLVASGAAPEQSSPRPGSGRHSEPSRGGRTSQSTST